MEVANWTSAGKIRADRIDVEQLIAEFADIVNVNLQSLWVNGFYLESEYFRVNGSQASWCTAYIGGVTFNYLGQPAYLIDD